MYTSRRASRFHVVHLPTTHAFTASSLLEAVKARERGYDIHIQTWDDDICLSKAERGRIPDRVSQMLQINMMDGKL